MKFEILILICSLSFSAYCQSPNCDTLLEKEINKERVDFAIDEFNFNIKTLVDCTLEPIDYQILVGPKEMYPNVAIAVLIQTFKQRSTKEKITYNDFKETFNELKKAEAYSKAKKAAIDYLTFSKQASTTKNWKKTKATLLTFDFSNSETDTLKQMVEYYEKNGIKNATFGQIISDIYSDKRKQIKDAHDRENSR